MQVALPVILGAAKAGMTAGMSGFQRFPKVSPNDRLVEPSCMANA